MPPDCLHAFEGPGPSRAVVTYRVHRKGRRVFAFVPADCFSDTRLYQLLPAHSTLAKLYRTGVQTLSRFGIAFPRETISIIFSSGNPFVELLNTASGGFSEKTAPILLPGNPFTEAQRTMIIARDITGQPCSAIKLGMNRPASALICKEHKILTQIRSRTLDQIPQLTSELIECDRGAAFSTEFIEGRNPSWRDENEAKGSLLASWIDHSTKLAPLSDSPWWSALRSAQTDLAPREKIDQMGALMSRPVLGHGDFAPWNILISRGRWLAIDWERGDLLGIPSWDWLHFEIQSALLIGKWAPEKIWGDARATLETPSFLQYLSQVFPITPHDELPLIASRLLCTYLFYNWSVLKPTEEVARHRALFEMANREFYVC